MTDLARLAADARKLTIRVVDEIRQDDQQRARIGPGKAAASQTQRACEADQQAQGGQMVRRDPGIDQRRDKPAGEARIPCPGRGNVIWSLWSRFHNPEIYTGSQKLALLGAYFFVKTALRNHAQYRQKA